MLARRNAITPTRPTTTEDALRTVIEKVSLRPTTLDESKTLAILSTISSTLRKETGRKVSRKTEEKARLYSFLEHVLKAVDRETKVAVYPDADFEPDFHINPDVFTIKLKSYPLGKPAYTYVVKFDPSSKKINTVSIYVYIRTSKQMLRYNLSDIPLESFFDTIYQHFPSKMKAKERGMYLTNILQDLCTGLLYSFHVRPFLKKYVYKKGVSRNSLRPTSKSNPFHESNKLLMEMIDNPEEEDVLAFLDKQEEESNKLLTTVNKDILSYSFFIDLMLATPESTRNNLINDVYAYLPHPGTRIVKSRLELMLSRLLER